MKFEVEEIKSKLQDMSVMFCSSCSRRECSSRCSKCKNAYYCNRKCQLADWKHHKQTCCKQYKDFPITIAQYQALPDVPYEPTHTRNCCAQPCSNGCILLVPSNSNRIYLYDIKQQAYSGLNQRYSDLGFFEYEYSYRLPYYSYSGHILVSGYQIPHPNNNNESRKMLISTGGIITPKNMPPRNNNDFIWRSHYAVFDCDKLKFDDIVCACATQSPENETDDNDNNNTEQGDEHDQSGKNEANKQTSSQQIEEKRLTCLIGRENVNTSRGTQATMFKNWMIATTPKFEQLDHLICIYEIDPCDNYPELLKTVELSSFGIDYYDINLRHHGCVVIPRLNKHKNRSKIDPGCDDGANRADILTFGGDGIPFANSFYMISIDFNNLENKESIIIEQNPNFIVQNIHKEIVNVCFSSGSSNCNSTSKQLKGKKVKAKTKSKQSGQLESINDLCRFSYHVIQDRYLLIIGGQSTLNQYGKHDKSHNRMFYFDFENQLWYVSPFLLPFTIFGHASVCLPKKNKIFIIGGMINDKQYSSAHFSVKLTHIIPDLEIQWNCERQIWIAFHKNSNNSECHIHLLCQDVVYKILNFLRL